MTGVDLEARIDLLERAVLELHAELRRVKSDMAAAVDQAKYAIRKLDQIRAALHEAPGVLPVIPRGL